MEWSATRRRNVAMEVLGPTPHSVGLVRGSTYKRLRSNVLAERRKQERLKAIADEMVIYNQKSDLKTTWEVTTEKKIQNNIIQRRVDSLMQQRHFSLEERRERLRNLMISEEEQYLHEMSCKKETPLERQARMRERARVLHDRREKERLAFVEQKLDQRWREQCVDLRGLESKRHLEEVTKDRNEQLRLKAEVNKRKEQDEAMYAEMWKEDWLTKSKREEMETALQIERNKEMTDLLNLLTAAKLNERENEKQLRQQEAELLREEAALRAIEEVKEKQEKLRKQEETKAILDHSLRIKMKRRAKETQEELALDMKLLEQMLTETSNEAKEDLERKNRMRKELHQYRTYLQEQAEENAKLEKELDAIVSAEVEKQWARRLAQWRKERDARKKLMQDVLETRKKQVQEKLDEIAKQKAEVEMERAILLKNIEEHKKLEKQQEMEKLKARMTYQEELLGQIDYQESVKEYEKEQEKLEVALYKEAEEQYQRRVQEAINKPNLEKIHPKRLAIVGQTLF